MRPETDFLNLDSLLTDEERMIRNTVRQFVDEQVKPIKLGLFGVTLPEKYGCANASNVSYGLICQELEAGDSGLRSFVSVQSSLCMYPIYAFGSEEQKMKYLPAMARGEIIACFGLTESNSGSDPGSMRTRAKRQQSVDHQRSHRRHCHRVGQSRRRERQDSRLHRADQYARLFSARDQTQTEFARFDHFGAFLSGCIRPRRRAIARKRRVEKPALVFDASAVRHRVGRVRRGD
jgi:hypothetical protein